MGFTPKHKINQLHKINQKIDRVGIREEQGKSKGWARKESKDDASGESVATKALNANYGNVVSYGWPMMIPQSMEIDTIYGYQLGQSDLYDLRAPKYTSVELIHAIDGVAIVNQCNVNLTQ